MLAPKGKRDSFQERRGECLDSFTLFKCTVSGEEWILDNTLFGDVEASKDLGPKVQVHELTLFAHHHRLAEAAAFAVAAVARPERSDRLMLIALERIDKEPLVEFFQLLPIHLA